MFLDSLWGIGLSGIVSASTFQDVPCQRPYKYSDLSRDRVEVRSGRVLIATNGPAAEARRGRSGRLFGSAFRKEGAYSILQHLNLPESPVPELRNIPYIYLGILHVI